MFFLFFFFLFISSSLVWRARERAVGLNFYRHIPFISIFIICFVYEHFFRSYALICYTQPKIKLEGKTKYIRLILSKLNKLFIILSSSNNHVWIFVYTLFCICFFVPHNIFCCCFSYLLLFLFVYVFLLLLLSCGLYNSCFIRIAPSWNSPLTVDHRRVGCFGNKQTKTTD